MVPEKLTGLAGLLVMALEPQEGDIRAKFLKKISWKHEGTLLIHFYHIDSDRRNSRKNFQKEFQRARGSAGHLKTQNWLKIENGYHPIWGSSAGTELVTEGVSRSSVFGDFD